MTARWCWWWNVCGVVSSHLTIRRKNSTTVCSFSSLLTLSHNSTHIDIERESTFSDIQSKTHTPPLSNNPQYAAHFFLWPNQLQWTGFPFVSKYKQQPLIYNQWQHLHQLAEPKERAWAVGKHAQTPAQMAIKDWHQQDSLLVLFFIF